MPSDVQFLSIVAVEFSSLCALFGVYLVLFILAVWATFRHEGKWYRRLRAVTILLFVDLVIHYIARALILSRARVIPTPDNENIKWTTPLSMTANITTTFAGLLSDGLLAWRFYVIYDRRPWALYIPVAAIIVNTFLGLSADLLSIEAYYNPGFYQDKLLEISSQITIAWGWIMFFVNSLLTGSIVGRIVYISRSTYSTSSPGSFQYAVILEAIVESAVVNWIGLLFYEIASLGPTGHVTTDLNVGYVLNCILPIFFGISQCLITARLGFATETRPSAMGSGLSASARGILGGSHPVSGDSTGKISRGEISVSVHRDVEVVISGMDGAHEKVLDVHKYGEVA